MSHSLLLCAAGCWALAASPARPAAPPQAAAEAWIDAHADQINGMSDAVWDYSELGFQETRSSRLLADALELGGFTVRRGVADMKTAFVAEYGSGRPVIAFLAEFDALPNMSQKAAPTHEPRQPGAPGHACGHNLLGTASVAAALAVKEAMDRDKFPGKIVVYGTPAEEGGSGKVYMVRDGLFRDVDAVIAWHPDSANWVGAGGSLAVKRARFHFTGVAAHAALEPDKGRSALDAVQLMNIGVEFLREHVPSGVRIHYIITKGGDRPNVVPEEAESWYYVRAPRMADTLSVYDRLVNVARGAALMTDARLDVRDESGTYDVLPNDALAQLVQRCLKRVGAPPFDEADAAFARELRKNTGLGDGDPLDVGVSDIHTDIRMTSTDVGDVSYTTPTVEFRVAAAPAGTATHTWPFAAAAGSPMGHKACRTAAKVMADSALELFAAPDELKPIREEFLRRTKGFTYRCGIPAGQKPPEKVD